MNTREVDTTGRRFRPVSLPTWRVSYGNECPQTGLGKSQVLVCTNEDPGPTVKQFQADNIYLRKPNAPLPPERDSCNPQGCDDLCYLDVGEPVPGGVDELQRLARAHARFIRRQRPLQGGSSNLPANTDQVHLTPPHSQYGQCQSCRLWDLTIKALTALVHIQFAAVEGRLRSEVLNLLNQHKTRS